MANLSRRPRLNGGKARLLDVRSDVVFERVRELVTEINQ
jgi:hypothetical protein